MKSKFVSFVTVSLATSLLFVPVQKAFGFDAEPQTNFKHTEYLVPDRESRLGTRSEQTHKQKLVQDGQANKFRPTHPTPPVVTASETTNSSQPSSAQPTDQLNNTAGGLLVTVLLISYILVGLQYRKHRTHRATVLLHQIETLEKIWKMNPQQR
ncbi:MAG TPA: hypothetical protein DCE56_44965 [Cyanobacteria bacterium UBA8553]|nr:hypothetical protein [Cyanobacteria bacterium UBA8553]HAJ60731.1 hypothetical protein [Cyanobacteria bacterium UBA8543]